MYEAVLSVYEGITVNICAFLALKTRASRTAHCDLEPQLRECTLHTIFALKSSDFRAGAAGAFLLCTLLSYLNIRTAPQREHLACTIHAKRFSELANPNCSFQEGDIHAGPFIGCINGHQLRLHLRKKKKSETQQTQMCRTMWSLGSDGDVGHFGQPSSRPEQ